MITVTLEPFCLRHIDRTFEWVSDADFRRNFLMRDKPSREGHRAYFDKVLADTSQCVYAIMAGGLHVGNCGFKHISSTRKDADLWIYIGDPAQRRKGIGKRATELLMKEGFENLGLELIYLHVANFNTAAYVLYKSLGFEEAPLPENAPGWSGRGCTVIRMERTKVKP